MWIAISIGVVALGLSFFGFKSYSSRDMEIKLGVDEQGMLEPCPEKPNCVNSQAQDEEHMIDPFPAKDSTDMSLVKIKQIVADSPRTEILSQSSDYVHATYTSRIFRFIDDVEFFLDRKTGVIHVRSASRVGHSDLGANRKRVEEIRQHFNQ